MSRNITSAVPPRRLVLYKQGDTEVRLDYETTCQRCARSTTGGKFCRVHNSLRRAAINKRR